MSNGGSASAPTAFDLGTVRGRQLAAIFRKARRRGLSQTALGKPIGWDQPKVSKLKTGRAEITDDQVQTLIDFLGVTQAEIDNFSERIFPVGSPESRYRDLVLNAVIGNSPPLQDGIDVRVQLDKVASNELADLPITQAERMQVLSSLVAQGFLSEDNKGQITLPRRSYSDFWEAIDDYERHLEKLTGPAWLHRLRSEEFIPILREVNLLMQIDSERFDLPDFMRKHRQSLAALAGKNTFNRLIADGASSAAWGLLETHLPSIVASRRQECAYKYAEIVSVHLRRLCAKHLSPPSHRRVFAKYQLPDVPGRPKMTGLVQEEYILKADLSAVIHEFESLSGWLNATDDEKETLSH